MINVSSAFKTALKNDNRNFLASCAITLGNGEILNISNDNLWSGGLKIEDATSNNGSFDVGAAIAQKLTLTLNNIYDEFTDYEFTDAVVSNVKISLVLPSGEVESVAKGIYTVTDTSYDGDIITLECLDNMHKFDVAYSQSNLTYPATLLQIVQDACKRCDMTLATDSLKFEYYDYVITSKPENTDFSFRDILLYVGQISGHFWKCNAKGQLCVNWYSQMNDPHTMNTDVVTDISVDMDDVVITGVRIIAEDENSEQTTYQCGSDGYCIEISDNELITKDNASEIATMIGGRVIGLRFRPLSASVSPDPTVEAGDKAILYDRKSKSYSTYLTDVTFAIDDDMQLSNDAESALRNSAERFSEAGKIYQYLKKHLSKNKSEWEKAMEELMKAMNTQAGLYPVIKTLDDGSKIYYMCDHQTLEESEVVFELNAEGWAVSTDGGKSWNAGLLVDGTMITKILNAIGLNADWINTGAFTVVDADGNVMFKADVDTGEVYINATSLGITGKSIEEIAQDSAKDYIESIVDGLKDVNTQYFGDYDPDLTNFPASEWDDTAKGEHINDLFYNTATTKTFRFVFDESANSYGWKDFNDPDIQLALDNASKAQDTADGKRRVFTVTPQPPYNGGDMWVTSMEDGEGKIKTCKTSRESGAFSSDDWVLPGYVDGDDLDSAITEYDTSLGQTEVFNKLTNGGQNQGIYIQDGKLYINADYILSGALSGKYIKAGTIDADKMNITDLYAIGATIGGWDVYSNRLESEDGSIILYSNGRICLGNATLSSISKAFTIKYGLHVYCSDASGFSDGTGAFKVFGLSHVTSGGHLVFDSDGATVSYLSSSSKRYKDHISEMTIEDAEKVLKIPVVWFKYKEGYLNKSDWLNGKQIPGFYAEDVYDIFPEATQINEDGRPEDWNFRVMIPAMLKLIQSQHKQITELKNVVGDLSERLSRLEAQMEV